MTQIRLKELASFAFTIAILMHVAVQLTKSTSGRNIAHVL